jgi:hypothetical protein
VRNGLLHNGGKMTKELELFRKQLHVNDDMFSISAVETSELACFLKDIVTRLLDIRLAKHRQT